MFILKISKLINELQLKNKLFISFNSLELKSEKSTEIKEVQFENKFDIFLTFSPLNPLKDTSIKEEHTLNI